MAHSVVVGRASFVTAWTVLLSSLLLYGCVSLTPAQSAGLREAQRFADEATAAHGVGRAAGRSDHDRQRILGERQLSVGHGRVSGLGDAPPAAAGEMADGQTREAIDRYAASFVAQSKVYAENRARAGRSGPSVWRFYLVHPCDQLDDLWSYYAIADPPPACETHQVMAPDAAAPARRGVT